MLAEHFLHIYCEKYNRKDCRFSQRAYQQMLNFNWRGNVRELQHVIERAVLLCKTGKIEGLNIAVGSNLEQSQAINEPGKELAVNTVSDEVLTQNSGKIFSAQDYSQLNHLDSFGDENLFEEIGKIIVNKLPESSENGEQSDVFNSIEYGVVLAALRRTGGNKQAAANLLGLYRPRLYGMIKRHNLDEKI